MARKTSAGRNAAGAGSIRKKVVHRNGKDYVCWEARCTVGYDPGTGKQQLRSITGKTQREVMQKLRQITLEIDQGIYHEPNKMTVGQWLDVWTTDYLGGVKPSSAHLYREDVRLYIKPALGGAKLEALTTPMIQHFYNQLVQPSHGHRGLAPKTVKSIHGVLRQALQKAVSLGYLRFNPADACTLPRVTRKQIQPLEGERLSYRTVYDCFKRIVADIGCPETRFHDLRHTYAVMALESGDDLKTVQENLGHHAASFTLDVYGHVTDRMRKQSAERMERLIRVVSGS